MTYSISPVLPGKNHHLSVMLPAEKLVLNADPLRFSQILSNLLTNAAKYTDPAGHIELAASLQGDTLRLTVKDNGIGIAADALKGIFEMFSQIDGASVRSDGGLGIGLSLVKGLLALHGGSVEAHSDGLGRGSEFALRLPLDDRLGNVPVKAGIRFQADRAAPPLTPLFWAVRYQTRQDFSGYMGLPLGQ